MVKRALVRIAVVITAVALIAAAAAWEPGISAGRCGPLEEVVNTGACVAGPGGQIVRNKVGKLVDLSRCTSYPDIAADEESYHKSTPSSDAPFDTTRDFDSGDIAVVFDDGTIITETVDMQTGNLKTNIDFVRLIKKFYLNPSHADVFQFVAVWPNFNHAEGSKHVLIKNGIRGIHVPIQDESAIYGTRKLESWVVFRNYLNFPLDPNARVDPNNNDSTLSLVGQEIGHRWSAFVHFDCDPTSRVKDCSDLLGRVQVHWCFFANVPAVTGAPHSSSLEGNSWMENPPGGDFQTVNTLGTGGYAELDNYLMGFRLPTAVSDTFVIDPPPSTVQTCSSRPYTPEIDGPLPVMVSGSRTNVSINDVIRIEGARMPDATMAPRKLRMAFLLLAKRDTTVPQGDIDRLNNIRILWELYFKDETEPGTVRAVTTLGPVDLDGDSFNTVTDCDDGDPLINPAAAESCNHIDDDCDGFVDEGFDADADLFTTCNGDCDDTNAAVNPNATETLGNGIDDNCDGLIDNPTPLDADADGYSPPKDCNDNSHPVNPGAVEKVDGIDNNCNGFLDCEDPTVVLETEKGTRASDGFDNDCNDIIDG